MCGKSFVEAKDMPMYWLHKCAEPFVVVLTLLCRGCPLWVLMERRWRGENTYGRHHMSGGD